MNAKKRVAPHVTLPPLLAAALVILCLALGGALVHAQPAVTTLAGQISNATTGSNLEGVRIRVDGGSRELLSTRDGTYEITGLAPGAHTLTFDYPGLDSQKITIDLVAGATARRDVPLNSGVYVLEKFTVSGEREGNAAAIAAQRAATNIQNIVTADAFGNIAKGNVGNFLRRIPGIAGTTDGVDTEDIMLRGMASNFTSLDIDGARYASGNTGRNQSALGIPTDMIERVEVIKSPTPDTEADSLGGRINLVTKSAYDRQGRQITLRAASSYSFTYADDVGRAQGSPLSPSLAASYADVYSVFGGRNNLGVYASANWERILDLRSTTSWDENNSTVNGVVFPRFNNVSVANHGVDRGGVTVKADYKASPALSLGASATFNTYSTYVFRTRAQLKSGAVRPALSPSTTFVVIDGASYGTECRDEDETTNRLAGRFYGKYKNTGGLRLDGDFSVQRSTRAKDQQVFNATSAQKINYVLDRREGFADTRWPALRVTSGLYTGATTTTTALPAAYLDVNPFADDFRNVASTSSLQWQRIFSKNELVRAKLDAAKKFGWRWPIEFKTGLSYRMESVKSSRDDLRGVMNLAPAGYGPDLRALLDNSWDIAGAAGRYPLGTVVDLDKITQALGIAYAGPVADPAARWNYNTKTFAIDNAATRQNTLQENRKIWEHVYGTYLQGTLTFGRLNLVGGARVEETENIRVQAARDRQAAGTLAEWTGRVWGRASYRNTFPSLHTRYAFAKNLVLNTSYGTTSGKPNWTTLLGIVDANETTHTINVPNLDLKPRSSKNYDATLAYYFEPVGVFSVGLFQKDIKNYDVTTEWEITAEEAIDLGATPAADDPTPWRLVSKANAGSGRVRGIEFNYMQSLSFLPGAFRGLGVFANYTLLTTQGTFDNAGIAGAPPTRTTRLQGFIPRTANAGLSYAYHRLDLRLAWNYTDNLWETTPTVLSTAKIRGERWTMDFSGKVWLTRTLSLFADLTNLTSNYGKKYRGYPSSDAQVETNALGFLATAGVQARF